MSGAPFSGTAHGRDSTRSQQVLKQALQFQQRIVEKLGADGIKKSPLWCEARYLRTLEFLAESNPSRQDYVLLWIFALLDSQVGFALDVAMEYERLFRADDISKRMREETVLRIRRASWITVSAMAKGFLPAGVKGWLKRYLQQHISSV